MKKIIFIFTLIFITTVSFSQSREHDNGPAFITKILFK